MLNRDTNDVNNQSTRMRKQSSNSNSPTITPTDPASRLHTLLRTISSVLTTYSTQPGALSIHLTALTQFHQRAVDLDLSPPSPHNHFSPMPHRNGSHSQNGSTLSPPKDLISSTSFLNLDPEAIMEGSPSPPRPGRSKPTPNPVPVPNDIGKTSDQQRPALSIIQPSISQKQGQDVIRSPSIEEIEQLEKEWWNSEVVAAFYGPRPEIISTLSSSRSNSGRSNGRHRRMRMTPMDSSLLDGQQKKGRMVNGLPRINFDKNIIRDASYVGLNDE